MTWFTRSAPKAPLDDLAHAVSHLRTDLDQLRTLCLDLDLECKKLRQERALRETEVADLRTRYETLVKRIGARVDRQAETAAEPILANKGPRWNRG